MEPLGQDAATNSVRGQVAVVTGAGRGIGRAIALALAEAGAWVAVCARSEDQITETAREIVARDGRALVVPADVSIRSDVEHLIAQVEQALGPVDLLVNNAGRALPVGAIAETDPDEWWQTMEVNVRGSLYCSRAVLPSMLARGRGRIVNVSSQAGFLAWPMLSAYAVSKAALLRLTENLAAETRGRGVQVFAVIPGEVRTAMTEAALSCGEPSVEQFFQGIFDQGADVPPERAADLVVHLASGQADRLSGRYVSAVPQLAGVPGERADVREMVARGAEIAEHGLYLLRPRELGVG